MKFGRRRRRHRRARADRERRKQLRAQARRRIARSQRIRRTLDAVTGSVDPSRPARISDEYGASDDPDPDRYRYA